jgi:hypothetical protein
MKARLLIAVLLLAVLLSLAFMLSNFEKTGKPGERGAESRREVELAGTSTETMQTPIQTTTYETIIYSASQQAGLPKAKQYALFDVIDIPGNVSLSVVYFEQVHSLDATYYEPFPNGTMVTHFNATYVPKSNETLYLATLAYVVRGDPQERGLSIPEGLCLRRHENPVTLTNCFIIPGLVTDVLFSTITAMLDFGLKILSGEQLMLHVIDENGRRYPPVERVVVDVMNITRDGSWYLAYKEYALRGLGENIIGKGSYAFILPKGARPAYLYLYISKTGPLSIFDPEKERPIALIKVG